jgi:hypothetical protein
MTCKLVNILNLIQCKYDIIATTHDRNKKYFTIPANPATGILYVTQNNLEFISGQIRMRGKNGGKYPYKYLEMIDNIFGKEEKTIEVCSGKIKEYDGGETGCYTVDINPSMNPDLVSDAQTLSSIANNAFNRWRCDPPYNAENAKKMYGTSMPEPIKLLREGARVCKVGSLMFLLLGNTNYQWHPKGVKRIGYLSITVVPNNEVRSLNIFYKYADTLYPN